MNIQSALVKAVLQQWRAYTWTIQGFGFMRTKLEDVGRIHIWDPRLAVPLVSTMHSHPWPLKSTIISGELINQRFGIQTVPETGDELIYQHSRIKTGEGGGLTGELERVLLYADSPEYYRAGEMYEQKPEEVHRTIAEPGTVTLLERPQGPPLEEASVFWPWGTNWVSAEPRPVDQNNLYIVQQVVEWALRRWGS